MMAKSQKQLANYAVKKRFIMCYIRFHSYHSKMKEIDLKTSSVKWKQNRMKFCNIFYQEGIKIDTSVHLQMLKKNWQDL